MLEIIVCGDRDIGPLEKIPCLADATGDVANKSDPGGISRLTATGQQSLQEGREGNVRSFKLR